MLLQLVKCLTLLFFISCGRIESKPANENEQLMEIMKSCLNNKAEVY